MILPLSSGVKKLKENYVLKCLPGFINKSTAGNGDWGAGG
jgi:hypothetical protein